MTNLEKQPKISVERFVAKYTDFIKVDHAPKEKVEEFLTDFKKLDNLKKELPDNFIRIAKTCQEYVAKLEEQNNKEVK